MPDETKSKTNTKIKLFSDEKVKNQNKDKETTKPSDNKLSHIKDLSQKYPDSVNFADNALKVIRKRYLVKDENRNPIETPKQMLSRVAKVLASSDSLYGATKDEIQQTQNDCFELMANLEFLPNSPTFTGAGTKLGQLSACFVLPIEDDMTQILRSQMNMGLIHKSGGGTGFSFSRLRPRDDAVGTTGGVSCGPIGFMQMFNDTTEQIKQGGTRRGANMGILRVDHPDIEEFIKYKADEGKLSNFNISVGITNKFMEAVNKDADFALINPRTKKETKRIRAREVFDLIVDYAWKNGEPGVIFIDHINAANPTPLLGEIESTNPCGEQPLLPYESCNLGAINLSKMTKQDEFGKFSLDEEKFITTIHKVVHILDNVIDANKYPIPEIEEQTLKTRKIGITLMGFADMLYQLGIAYNSEEGIKAAEYVSGIIERESHLASQKLAKTRGSFPAFKGSKWDKPGASKIRNAATTSCNPTGTLSIIAACSSGIEPTFALAYVKTVMDGTALPEVNPYFQEIAKQKGFYSDELVKTVTEKGSIQDIDEVPEDIKKVFVVASDIAPEWHVRMQAAFQRHTDAGISKTINFPNSATRDDVAAAYNLAYELKCKGLTIYRDGSRITQVLTVGTNEKSKEEVTEITPHGIELTPQGHIQPRKRPEVVKGYTYKVKTGYGNMYVTINDDERGEPFEVFAHIGKTGGFFAAKAEAICRLISLALRSGIDPQTIIDDLKGIRGPSPIWGTNGSMILSMPDAIGQLLERHIHRHEKQLTLDIPAINIPNELTPPDEQPVNAPPIAKKSMADYGHAPICQECGSILQLGEGCLKCPSCGYSKCG